MRPGRNLASARVARHIAARLALPSGALLLAGLACLLPVHDLATRTLRDRLHRALAQEAGFDSLMVVDIDDASIRALQPRLGAWPYHRDVYALVLNYLRDVHAKVVVFDVVFADPRDGDAVFARALSSRPDAALAAAASRQALERERDGASGASAFSIARSPSIATTSWAGLTLPAPLLTASVDRFGAIGIVGAALDADRQVRRVPLLHEVDGRVYPSLALSARLLASPGSRPGGGAEAAAALRESLDAVPLDAAGCVDVHLPANAGAVPRIPFQRVVQAALGDANDPGVEAAIAGKTVFVGSTVFLGDAVGTTQGELSGAVLLANVVDALATGRLLRPAPWAMQLGLMGVALLPALLAPLLLVRPRWAAAGLLAAAAAILLLSAALLRGARVEALPLPALYTIGATALLVAASRWRMLLVANRRLAQERRIAEAANAAKSEFLSTVSHELRTPLNALLGMADVLSHTTLSDEQRHYVSIFQGAGASLASLIDDLLDYGRIEAGKLAIDRHPFDLRDLLDQLALLLRPRAELKSLALAVDLNVDVPTVVLGDRKRIAQVLTNLLGNAVKFTHKGSVTLQVSAQGGQQVRFSVRDSGIGIAPSKLDAIFVPFVQGGAGVTRRYGGTGLGLAISRRLVELMGGSLEVQSVPGMGSAFSFTIELPIAAPTPPLEVEAAPERPPDPLAVRILLAEDNEVNTLVIQAMLKGTPHSIDIAVNGAIAVDMFRTGDYGLLLMDMDMPIMDGLAAVRAIRSRERRERRSRTPILALTANAFAQDAQDSAEAGCDGHLTKPISQKHLWAAIALFGRSALSAPAPVAARPPEAFQAFDRSAALQALGGDVDHYERLLSHGVVYLSVWEKGFLGADAATRIAMCADLEQISHRIGAGRLADAAGRLASVLARRDDPLAQPEWHALLQRIHETAALAGAAFDR